MAISKQLCLTFAFQAAGQMTWLPDRDYVLVALYGASTLLLTTNPTAVLADYSAPAANRMSSDVLHVRASAGFTNPANLNMPVLKGQKIYLTSGAAGIVQLYLNP